MRYCILGDIHGNLQALDAVVKDAESQRAEAFLCLGDVVGYGADPATCIQRVQALGAKTVAGNHDFAISGRLSDGYFNEYARTAIRWTRAALTKEDVAWLDGLPLSEVVGDITLAHGTIHDPHVFDYMQTSYDAYLSFGVLSTSVGFVGHSHVPVAFTHGVPITYSLEERIVVGKEACIANPGSVGQPRDENPHAAYAMYNDESKVIEFKRVAYDIDAAAHAIVAAGLPAVLADRLFHGR